MEVRGQISASASRPVAVRAGLIAGLLLIAAGVLGGCATNPARTITIDQDRSADFSAFRSYGFPVELGTDRAGYSTLITSYFKQAVDREMQKRGFYYSHSDPDLLVNFFANVRDVTDIRRSPQVALGYGYFGYRYGLYGAWPHYQDSVETVHYKVGTANVDIVDADRSQLIWEGVAEGRLTRDAMQNPQAAIDAVVAELFMRFPGHASAGNLLRSESD